MKKTEAISILATSVRPREPKDRARYDEVVKMAIEALKCSEIPNSSDTISRQAAIDAVNDLSYPSSLVDVKRILVGLPAVQPDHTADISKKVEVEDCISRQWLMECVNEGWIKFDTEKDENRFIHLVRDIAPSTQPDLSEYSNKLWKSAYERGKAEAQAEIIRCKDCKYWRDDHTCHEHSLVSPMCANEYCSRAERGNDGHID